MHPEVQQLERVANTPLTGDVRTGPSEASRLADLLDEIETLILRFISLPEPALAMLLALWIAQTYTYELFRYVGYLALRSPTPRCGKSQLLRLMALVAKGNPPITTLPTAAVLFRGSRPVLILDEVDRLRNADKDVYGDVLAVLNVRFEKGAVVERMDRAKGGGFVVKSYLVYGPTALAGIESFADTLADRAFYVVMKRATTRTPRLNVRRLEEPADRIRNGLESWAICHARKVEEVYEALPDEVEVLKGLDDRLQDMSEPLVVLASLADAERPEGPPVLPRLLAGLNVATGRRECSVRERQLLALLEIAEAKLVGAEEVFIPSKELLEACAEREEISGIETPRGLASVLKHFDLTPGFDKAKLKRGYWLKKDWVDGWRARYGGVSEVG